MTTVINNNNIHNLVKLYCTNQKNELPEDLRNIPIGNWDVSKVTNMEKLFMNYSNFNEPLNGWNVSSVTNMSKMFRKCKSFNQPLDNWNVSNVSKMDYMFSVCSTFNQPLNNWRVSNVNNMFCMFFTCLTFNQLLTQWDVSNVENMEFMFFMCRKFNQPLNIWKVTKVKSMNNMFGYCLSFNQNLNNWDVSNVNNMSRMFYKCAKFNQPLNNWNVSRVNDISSMFDNCHSFDQPLNNWNLSTNVNFTSIFDGCPISEENKPALIIQKEHEKNDERLQYLILKTPLEKSLLQINPSSQNGSDLINMEQDINVLNFINEDPKNIAFYFNNQIYLTSKDSLHYSITDPENKGKNIKYECLRTGSMNPSNIVFTNPYFSMRTIGSYGLVSLGQINEIIQNESIRYVEMTTEPMKQLVSTASFQVTGPNPNYVSASHCQEGQGENVYNLLNITNKTNVSENENEDEQKIKRPKLGGKKRKYTKRRTHRRKHRGTKKRKIKEDNKSKRR
jgi:surface protein